MSNIHIFISSYLYSDFVKFSVTRSFHYIIYLFILSHSTLHIFRSAMNQLDVNISSVIVL